ncbi:MAG: trypsin-like peptidase domain-containing protein [Bryobacterales bacterium]|nr:trypsin-like peptidase domain-containing protein [Bryobacterales bacterium]
MTDGYQPADQIPKVYLEASKRLARKHDEAAETHRQIADGNARFLEPEQFLKRRVKRLLDNPTVAKQLGRLGVTATVLDAPIDQLGPEAQSGLERVLSGAEFLPTWFLTRGSELRRTVGRVVARASSGGFPKPGTGFLVAPGVLLTNRHVLDWSDIGQPGLAEIVPQTVVEFDNEEGLDNLAAPPQARFRLRPDILLLASEWHDLDYVLVAVESRSLQGDAIGIESLGFNRLTGELGKINKGEPVFIIQHPRGEPKKVVLRNNLLVSRDEASNFLTYEANTDRGSSGSPVYNREWEVVALHHSVEIARDGNGMVLTRDGGLWTPAMGPENMQLLRMNEGVRVSRILSDLARKCDAIAQGAAGALAAHERYNPQGLGMLHATLRFRLGASPAEIAAPVVPRPEERPRPSTGRRFPRPE